MGVPEVGSPPGSPRKSVRKSVKNKILECVRVRAILPDENALESWAKSIELPDEKLSLIKDQYAESLQRLKEYGVTTRIIDHVAPNTIIASDKVIANKINYTLSRSESSSLIIMRNNEYIKEHRHMFESLWQTSKEVITNPSSGSSR